MFNLEEKYISPPKARISEESVSDTLAKIEFSFLVRGGSNSADRSPEGDTRSVCENIVDELRRLNQSSSDGYEAARKYASFLFDHMNKASHHPSVRSTALNMLSELVTIYPQALPEEEDGSRGIMRGTYNDSVVALDGSYICSDGEKAYVEDFQEGNLIRFNDFFDLKVTGYKNALCTQHFRAPNGDLFLENMWYRPDSGTKAFIHSKISYLTMMSSVKRVISRGRSFSPYQCSLERDGVRWMPVRAAEEKNLDAEDDKISWLGRQMQV